jgi:hypothetical protein
MGTTLLIKEFVELARALGSASSTTKEIFNEYLKGKGFANLNDYKTQEDDEELAERNFKQWLEVIEDGSLKFAWGGIPVADNVTVEQDTPSVRIPKEDLAEEEEEELTLPEEEVTIRQVIQESDADTNAKEVLRIVKEGFANLANVNVSQPHEGHGKAIDALVNKHKDLDNLVSKCWTQLKSHMTDEVQHGAGGSFSSFDINILPANKKWEGEQPLHYKFPLVAAAVTNRIPTMIVGPAGWGKTSTIRALASACADAWDDEPDSVDYRIQSIGPQTSKSDILGYMDANGNYVKSVFFDCFSKGMLYACDEADAGSAGSLTLLNQGFANEECHFPGQDSMTPRHENFVPMFLANTFGLGANATYVGRNQLDAATIDRFAVVEYDYDERWEGTICGVDREGSEVKLDAGGTRTPEEWVDWVSRIRNAVDSLAIRHVVSPRASINGIKLLKAGLGFTHVSNMCVWKGLDSATRAKVINETNS